MNKLQHLFLVLILAPNYIQAQSKLFNKHYNLKSGVSTVCYEVLIDNFQNILVAQPFGIDYFDGIKWKRDRVSKDTSKIPLYVRIRKNKHNSNSFVIGGKFSSGFIEQKRGKFHFSKIVDESESKNILGGWLTEIFQLKNRTYFLGRSSGVIVYDHLTKKKTSIPKLSLTSSFRYHKINDHILLQAYNGEVYILTKNAWVVTDKHPMFNKYIPTRSLRLDTNTFLFFSRKKRKMYYSKDNQLIELKALSKILKNDFILRFRQYLNTLYIKSNNKLIIFDLKKRQTLFLKEFKQIVLHEFDIDKQGNIWVSSDQGLFFVETNVPFQAFGNNSHMMKKFYDDDCSFEITKNSQHVNITYGEKQKTFKKIGAIYGVSTQNRKNFICTSKGIFIFDKSLMEINKVYSGEAFNIFYNDQKFIYYILASNKIVTLDQKFKVKVENKIPSINYTKASILYKNNIFYSTTNNVTRIALSPDGKTIIKNIKLTFPRKIFYSSQLYLANDKLIVSNAYGIFEIDAEEEFKIKEITKNITNLPKDKTGNYTVYFTFTHFIDSNKILTTPVYIGENKGKNLPLILSKNAQGEWQAYSQYFKRLEKTLVLDVAKTPRNTYEFITNDHIIEYDPNKKVNTDYAFKAYIRSTQVKIKQTDSASNKETLIDSSIYYGNLATPPTVTLPYSHNTLTFTYASDSWAAYERNLYSYQLTGLDEGWSNWSTEQKKEYTHLREGRYTFKVRCKNVYGTISSVDSYTFTILPPWHRTTWAYALYVLAGLALLIGGSYGYSRYRSRQLYKRNQHLEQVVTERTEEILAQKEEISQQAEMLQNANNDLKQANEQIKLANEQIKKEKDEKVKIYLQEATEAANKLQQVRNTLAKDGSEEAQKILKRAISGVDEFVIIREKVRKEYPDFTERIDQALMDKKITKLVWQVGYCLKLGMLPAEVAEVLPTNNRSVSTHGSNLRRLGILEPIKKS